MNFMILQLTNRNYTYLLSSLGAIPVTMVMIEDLFYHSHTHTKIQELYIKWFKRLLPYSTNSVLYSYLQILLQTFSASTYISQVLF